MQLHCLESKVLLPALDGKLALAMRRTAKQSINYIISARHSHWHVHGTGLRTYSTCLLMAEYISNDDSLTVFTSIPSPLLIVVWIVGDDD